MQPPRHGSRFWTATRSRDSFRRVITANFYCCALILLAAVLDTRATAQGLNSQVQGLNSRTSGQLVSADALSSNARSGTHAAKQGSSVQFETRIVWGGAVPRSFKGRIWLDRGTIRVARNLCLEPHSIGKIRSSNLSSVDVTPFGPTTFGGADLTLKCNTNQVLHIAFEDPTGKATVEHDIPVTDLLAGDWIEELDDRGTRIAIQRQVHDRIQVFSDQPSNVLETGMNWGIRIAGNRTGLEAGEYELSVDLRTSSGRTQQIALQTVEINSDGNFDPLPVQVRVPDEEGAHTLTFGLRKTRFLQSILPDTSVLERNVEFVGFATTQTPHEIAGWTQVGALNALQASKPGFLSFLSPISSRSPLTLPDKVQDYNPLAGSFNQPTLHGSFGSRPYVPLPAEDVDAVACLTIAPAGWIALPLNGLESGIAHRLVIRTPQDQPMQLLASLKQPDSQGNLRPISSDYEFSLTKRECSQNSGFASYEILFWPASGSNVLLLANPSHETDSAVFDVQIERGLIQPIDQEAEDKLVSNRLAGFYLDKPLLADFVGSPREPGGAHGQQLESWATWQTTCTRLVQWLRLSDANLLVLKVQADGGAVFPNATLAPTVRYDNGVFHSDGRSPNIKDAVELMLRHCDRSQIRVVLALDLDTLLPSLDRWKNDANQALFQQELSPQGDFVQRPDRYNPLNSRVQAEFTSIVRDIVNRYGGHESFGGIQVQLDNQSQLIFAGDRWGYDRQQFAQFQKHTGARLPQEAQIAQAFQGSLRLAYLQWRATELTRLWSSLGAIVASANPESKLYLNATRLWDTPPNDANFHRPLEIAKNPAEFIAAHGIDVTGIRSLEHVELLQGKFQQDKQSSDSSIWIREVAQQRGLSGRGQAKLASAIVAQRPHPTQLAHPEQLEGKWGLGTFSGTLYPLASGTALQTRKEIVEQLYESDIGLMSCGAWLPVCNQSSPLKELRRTIQQLPPVAMIDIPMPSSDTHLKLRWARHNGASYFLLVNNSPWREELTLHTQGSQPSPELTVLAGRLVELSGIDPQLNGLESWEMAIGPYDAIGVRVDDEDFRIRRVDHRPSTVVMEQISDELAHMEGLLAMTADPTRQERLADLRGDFEHWTADGTPAGWNVSSLPGVQISASSDLPRSGRMSLQIRSSSPRPTSAWIQSSPFAPPTTNRLAVHAWLRSSPREEAPLVRVSVIGRGREGERFERWQQLGAESTLRIPNDWGTRPATLFVSDVPAEGIDELSVSVELIGPGTVWVDDVEVYQSWLHPDERIYLQGRLFAAKHRLADNNPFPAEELLDSHWGRYLSRLQPVKTKPGIAGGATTSTPVQREPGNWNSSPTLLEQLRQSVRERWRR